MQSSWSSAHRSTCLTLLSDRIKGMFSYAFLPPPPPPFWGFNFLRSYGTSDAINTRHFTRVVPLTETKYIRQCLLHVAAHAFKPLRRKMKEHFWEFKISLLYILSSRPQHSSVISTHLINWNSERWIFRSRQKWYIKAKVLMSMFPGFVVLFKHFFHLKNNNQATPLLSKTSIG